MILKLYVFTEVISFTMIKSIGMDKWSWAYFW